jgi:hypothetical protein
VRKKLIATAVGPGGSSSSYEFTVDDNPPLPTMAEQAAGGGMEQTDNNTGNIPPEVQQAIVQGNIDEAKSLLEKAGYSVEVRNVGEGQ